MLIDGRNETFLLAFQSIPHSKACGWRAGVIVVAPCHIGLCLDIGGKTTDVKIRKSLQVLFCKEAFSFREMGIAVSTTFLDCGCHVAERGMVGHAERHPWIEGSGNKSQCPTLTAALNNDVASVSFGQLCQEIDATNHS